MAYRGTGYHGYQIQSNAVTIQQTVEDAVSSVLNEKITINGCSRTDTGVHANNYVFSVLTDSNISHRGFMRGVNGRLPDDISILACEDADLDFHARFNCKAKEYMYLIHASECKNPFAKDLMLHYRRPLDINLISEAAQKFVGTHNFRSFCSQNTDKINTVRTIYYFNIEVNGDCVKILVKGDGFLYNMVRILVGTLLCVNEKLISLSDIDSIFNSNDRSLAGRTAQPYGLYLNRVFY